MATSSKNTVEIAKTTFKEFAEDDCASMAAALAYYTIFSLPPLLVIVITIAGFFWGQEAIQGQVNKEMQGVVGEAGVEQMAAMLAAAGEHKRGVIATIVGIVLLIFGATGVMVQLQAALNRAFEVEAPEREGFILSFIRKRMLSFAMILTIAFLLVVSLVMTTVLTKVGEQFTSRMGEDVSRGLLLAVDFLVNFLVLGAMFAAMLRWLPDTEVAWKHSLVGGALTAVFFLIGKFLLGIYLGMQDPDAYGPAASLVMILIWVYYSAMIFLLGAEFTHVWGHRGEHTAPHAEAAGHVTGTRPAGA